MDRKRTNPMEVQDNGNFVILLVTLHQVFTELNLKKLCAPRSSNGMDNKRSIPMEV